MAKSKKAAMAAELAALWGDEYLTTREPDELAEAFKISLRVAEKIISEELKKRGLS